MTKNGTIVCVCVIVSVSLRLAEQLPITAGPAIPARKKLYDEAYKLKVIKYAETHSNREAARRLHMGENSMKDWKKQEKKY